MGFQPTVTAEYCFRLPDRVSIVMVGKNAHPTSNAFGVVWWGACPPYALAVIASRDKITAYAISARKESGNAKRFSGCLKVKIVYYAQGLFDFCFEN